MNLILIPGLLVASTMDWKFRKIPNWLTLSMAILAILFHTIDSGFDGFTHSTLGLLAGFALLYLPFRLGGMGGGDVKFLAAIGACLGPQGVFYTFLIGTILGGIVSIIEVTRNKAWKKTWAGISHRLLLMAAKQKFVSESEVASPQGNLRIPYALVLSAGAIMIYTLGGELPWNF